VRVSRSLDDLEKEKGSALEIEWAMSGLVEREVPARGFWGAIRTGTRSRNQMGARFRDRRHRFSTNPRAGTREGLAGPVRRLLDERRLMR
jgi:hypothetical protein